MDTKWIKVATALRDQSRDHRDTAEKLRKELRDLRSIEYGAASLVLLSLAVAIEKGTD